jgi:hypothetical protein
MPMEEMETGGHLREPWRLLSNLSIKLVLMVTNFAMTLMKLESTLMI